MANKNITSKDVEKFIAELYNLRKSSIASEGEYGIGNLVFKQFRSLGYLSTLKKLRKQLKSEELSLESLNESSGKIKKALFGDYTNKIRTFAILTAENPMGIEITPQENNKLSKEFGEILSIFEIILDISLLKPIDEWNDEEINAKKKYYEKEYKDNIENNPNEDNNEK